MSSIAGVSMGIYEKALPTYLTWHERLVMAADAGFDFVELSLDPSAERLARLSWLPDQRRELREAAHALHMPMLTMCLSAHRMYPLGSADESVRDRGLQIMRQAINLATDLGIRIVQVAGYDTETGDSSTDSRQRYTEGVHQAAIWASQSGILLGLENQEMGYIDSPSQALQVIQQLDSPYVQMYMDVGNLVVNERDVLHEIAIAKGHLLAIHLKDARPGVPRRVPFGEGSVPFEEVFEQLANIRFTGPMMIEMWNDDRDDALTTCIAARRWVESRLSAAWNRVGHPQ